MVEKLPNLSSLNIELYGCKTTKLSDRNYIRNFLYNLPSEIGMRRIGKPLVYRTEDPETMQGFVMLAESHAFIYAWPDYKFGYVGILSCKTFDTVKASKSIAKKFDAKQYKKKNIAKLETYLYDDL